MSEKYIRQEENIKNCPFCGSSVSVERVPLEHYQGCVIFKIKCSNCGSERTLTKNDSVYRTEEEARANAIAQWNERPSLADVPQEMSAVEYFKQVRRLQNWADQLQWQYHKATGTLYKACDGDINSAIEEVEKWARENPERSEE